MFKKIALRASLAATAIGVGVALLPSAASVLNLGPTVPVAATGATTIALSPASNPAFKVNGFTSCASGRTGHLWEATTITATSVKDGNTEEVRVTLGQGGPIIILSAPGFSTVVPTSQNFDCTALNPGGNALPYVANSYKNGNPQGGPAGTGSGNYSITLVD